jgi:hypothetical protein
VQEESEIIKMVITPANTTIRFMGAQFKNEISLKRKLSRNGSIAMFR